VTTTIIISRGRPSWHGKFTGHDAAGGKIDMEHDRTNVHLKAGDVFVQRRTSHDRINRGGDAGAP
jgi:hypothetical protein